MKTAVIRVKLRGPSTKIRILLTRKSTNNNFFISLVSIAKKNKSSIFNFTLWLLVAFIIGFSWKTLNQIPNSFNCDELAIGINSRFIAESGRDEHGVKLPLKFQSFGDWKMPVYIYLASGLQKIFGEQAITLRLINNLLGVFGLIPLALMVKRTIKDRKKKILVIPITLIIGLITPWHFFGSHVAMEAMLAQIIFSFAWWLSEKNNTKSWIGAQVLLGLCLLTYHAAIVFVPLWYGLNLIFKINFFKTNKIAIFSSIIFVIFSLLIVRDTVISQENSKIKGTSIFNYDNEKLWQESIQYRDNSIGSRLRHNQYGLALKNIGIQLANYSQILFVGNIESDALSDFKHFLFSQLTLAIIAIFYLFKNRRTYLWNILFSLLAAFTPGLITYGTHTNRLIFVLPIIIYLTAIGIMNLTQIKWLKAYLILIFVFEAFFWLLTFHSTFNIKSSPYYDSVLTRANEFVLENEPFYTNIYITYPFEQPYIYYAYYSKITYPEFKRLIQLYAEDEKGFAYAKQLGKIRFVKNIKDLKKENIKLLRKSLVITRLEEVRYKDVALLKKIKNNKGKVEIVAINAFDYVLATVYDR